MEITVEEFVFIIIIFIVISVVIKNLEIITRRMSWRFGGKRYNQLEIRVSDLELSILKMKNKK